MLSCSYPKEILLIDNSENISDKKRKYIENSVFLFLWHRRLGHVSKERLQSLIKVIKQSTLPTLDFSDLVDCIKGKEKKNIAKQKRKTFTRSTGLLQLIQRLLCIFAMQSICGNRCFIDIFSDSTMCISYQASHKH